MVNFWYHMVNRTVYIWGQENFTLRGVGEAAVHTLVNSKNKEMKLLGNRLTRAKTGYERGSPKTPIAEFWNWNKSSYSSQSLLFISSSLLMHPLPLGLFLSSIVLLEFFCSPLHSLVDAPDSVPCAYLVSVFTPFVPGLASSRREAPLFRGGPGHLSSIENIKSGAQSAAAYIFLPLAVAFLYNSG